MQYYHALARCGCLLTEMMLCFCPEHCRTIYVHNAVTGFYLLLDYYFCH